MKKRMTKDEFEAFLEGISQQLRDEFDASGELLWYSQQYGPDEIKITITMKRGAEVAELVRMWYMNLRVGEE